MCGMVASPTPTVPISSDSTSVIESCLRKAAERGGRHPASGSAAHDDDPALTHFTHGDASLRSPGDAEALPGLLKISRVPAPAAAAEAEAAGSRASIRRQDHRPIRARLGRRWRRRRWRRRWRRWRRSGFRSRELVGEAGQEPPSVALKSMT